MSIVLAHRGASGHAPENTLEAFRLAMDMGADGFELDVHMSRDGQLVVIHDDTVDRTTNGTGLVKELTLAQIQALDAGNKRFYVTLSEQLQELFALETKAEKEKREREEAKRQKEAEEKAEAERKNKELLDRLNLLEQRQKQESEEKKEEKG